MNPADPSAESEEASGTVRLLLVVPADPERMAIGGIASFIRGFVKFAPNDFDIGLVGLSATRHVGAWHDVELEGRPIAFLPVARGRAERRTAVPVALRFAAGLLRHRHRLPLRGQVLSFHRPGTDLPFRRDAAPRWRVVHLSVEDLTTLGSESRWRWLPRVLAHVERASFRRMNQIYVVNEAVADAYRRRYPELADRISYVPNWADATIFRPPSPEERAASRAELARDLSLSDAGMRLLYAGRLEGQKNPLLLAEAFAAIRARHPAATLLVAGEGTLEGPMGAVLARSGAADRVRYLGTQSRERLAYIMRGCDVLLITSRYETGPTVGFEALASGLPIAMTHVGQVSTVVREHAAGCTVERHTADALAEAVDWIAAQPADRLRSAALAAASQYRADRVLKRLYDDTRAMSAAATVA